MSEGIEPKELAEFLELKDLNQISVRIYYLYYRTLEAFREERDSLFRYSFDTITAVVGGFLGIATFVVFLQQLADIYKGAAVVFTVGVIVILLFVRERLVPRGELAVLRDTVRLGIHLDQLFKQSVEVMWLDKLLENPKGKEMAADFVFDCCTVLQDSISSIEDILASLRKSNKLKEAMEELHIDETLIERRVELGKRLLTQHAK
jgi:hypothetical protein